jgi:hypothetical protein
VVQVVRALFVALFVALLVLLLLLVLLRLVVLAVLVVGHGAGGSWVPGVVRRPR